MSQHALQCAAARYTAHREAGPRAFNLCACKDNVHRYCVKTILTFMLFVCSRRGVIMSATSLPSDVSFVPPGFYLQFLSGWRVLTLVMYVVTFPLFSGYKIIFVVNIFQSSNRASKF